MSLQKRLTIIYSTVTGGILFIFGMLIFVLISTMLDYQAQGLLTDTANSVLQNLRIDQVGNFNLVTLPSLELTNGVYIQLWNTKGELAGASPGISMMTEPFDREGLRTAESFFKDVYVNDLHLRVLSTPLKIGSDDHIVGVIQAAYPLRVADAIRRILAYALFGVTLTSVVIAAVSSWVMLGKTLAPLKTATRTADQIIRADDLSRRIPYNGPSGDEIGSLIESFNSTLERLENLFTSQQRFLADVSHELRTPLTVIKGNADLIRKFGADEESINSIKDETDRLSRLVGDLLFLAQAESGKLHLKLAPVELDTLLLEVMNEMRVLAAERVTLSLSEIDQVLIEGDRDRLKQVLINLVSNAIHYSPKGSEVVVGIGKDKGQAWIKVRDNGPGIPKEDLPFIFDRFYRGEKSRTRSKATGFGLGLSIAYWIVSNHGGRIEVDTAPGKGTAFTIWLPFEVASVDG